MSPSKLLWMVCRVFCIVVAVAMIGGNCSTIWGTSVSMLPMPLTILSMPSTIAVMSVCRAPMLSLNVFTPSRASNADRTPQQAGMLKQFGSQ